MSCCAAILSTRVTYHFEGYKINVDEEIIIIISTERHLRTNKYFYFSKKTSYTFYYYNDAWYDVSSSNA